MAREPRYLTLFILSVIIVSSTYMVWSAERGLGEVTVENMQITRTNGRVVDFSVYKPRIITYGKPLPVVLTIHGISASRGEMLPINIELARRNFTVVSVDLAGHGIHPRRSASRRSWKSSRTLTKPSTMSRLTTLILASRLGVLLVTHWALVLRCSCRTCQSSPMPR